MKYLLDGVETERLFFRKVEESDFDYWLKFFEHPNSADYLGLGEDKDPYKQCRNWFDRLAYRYENDLGGMNMLIDKAAGEAVGQCGILIQEVDKKLEFEIGYSIMPRFWGLNFATEAAIKCKECAFERNYTNSLISIIHVDNIRSEKVARKNGMDIEKQTIFRDMPVNIFRINKKLKKN